MYFLILVGVYSTCFASAGLAIMYVGYLPHGVPMFVIGVVLAIVGFVVALSVVGAVVLAVVAVMFALLLEGVSAFWPIIVIAIALYALKKRNSAPYSQKNEHNMHHTL